MNPTVKQQATNKKHGVWLIRRNAKDWWYRKCHTCSHVIKYGNRNNCLQAARKLGKCYYCVYGTETRRAPKPDYYNQPAPPKPIGKIGTVTQIKYERSSTGGDKYFQFVVVKVECPYCQAALVRKNLAECDSLICYNCHKTVGRNTQNNLLYNMPLSQE